MESPTMNQVFVDESNVCVNLCGCICSRKHRTRVERKDVYLIADYRSGDFISAVGFVRFRFWINFQDFVYRDSLSEEPNELIDSSEVPRSLQNPKRMYSILLSCCLWLH